MPAAKAPALPRLGLSSRTLAPADIATLAVVSVDPSEMMWMLLVETRRDAARMVSAMTSSSLCAATRTATSAGLTRPSRGLSPSTRVYWVLSSRQHPVLGELDG